MSDEILNNAEPAKNEDTQELSVEQIEGAVGGVSTSSLSDMSQLDSLQLQNAMQSRSQTEQAVSNVMKKMDDTADGIVQNLK